MTKDEYVKKARDLGYSEEEMAENIKLVEEAKADGVRIPYELGLDEKLIY